MKGTDFAPPGKVWRCAACGRHSRTRYGFGPDDSDFDAEGKRIAERGWDESCMLKAELVDVDN